MNKKTKTILLLIIAILIWGYSALEWIRYYKTENYNKNELLPPVIQPNNLTPIKRKNNLTLSLNYNDPFLKTNKHNKAISNPPPLPASIKIVPPQKVSNPTSLIIKWPKIKYSGIINNFGLLNIDGQNVIVKNKDVIKDITIKDITNQYIVLIYNNEEKTFNK